MEGTTFDSIFDGENAANVAFDNIFGAEEDNHLMDTVNGFNEAGEALPDFDELHQNEDDVYGTKGVNDKVSRRDFETDVVGTPSKNNPSIDSANAFKNGLIGKDEEDEIDIACGTYGVQDANNTKEGDATKTDNEDIEGEIDKAANAELREFSDILDSLDEVTNPTAEPDRPGENLPDCCSDNKPTDDSSDFDFDIDTGDKEFAAADNLDNEDLDGESDKAINKEFDEAYNQLMESLGLDTTEMGYGDGDTDKLTHNGDGLGLPGKTGLQGDTGLDSADESSLIESGMFDFELESDDSMDDISSDDEENEGDSQAAKSSNSSDTDADVTDEAFDIFNLFSENDVDISIDGDVDNTKVNVTDTGDQDPSEQVDGTDESDTDSKDTGDEEDNTEEAEGKEEEDTTSDNEEETEESALFDFAFGSLLEAEDGNDESYIDDDDTTEAEEDELIRMANGED